MTKGPSGALIPLLAGTLVASATWAQAPPGLRLDGRIERIDGQTLVLDTAQGQRPVRIAPDALILVVSRGNLAEVKPGSFIGVGATPMKDGSQRAIQVTVFAEPMRGTGEGHRPWNRPGTTMTNATVEATVASVDGQVVNVRYKDGEKKIVIGPEAVIRSFRTVDRSELKVGTNVTINARPEKAGAAPEALRVTIDRTGPAQ